MTNYVVVTPARDEEAHIEFTILSMVRQTITPLRWIVIDDGSRDGTGAILDRYAALYPWIVAVHRADRGVREAGGGVIRAFYEGFAQIEKLPWDFLAKLDADLSFGPTYFERCFAEFTKDPKLGIGGGCICHGDSDSPEIEPNPVFHVRGATKIYRRECWAEIGGLLVAPGWDTVDEVKANMLGWRTRTFMDLQILHHRFTGAADGAWKDSVKNGRANFISGYHPLFMLLKSVRRLVRRPYLIGSCGLLWGFLSGYANRSCRVTDRALIKYIRSQQMRRLLCLESIWK